jgi:hypothetical protein
MAGDTTGDRIVRTRGATFVATTSENGGTAVVTRHGAVILQAHGREVVIRTGQYARVLPGQAPEAPTAIPPSLFLKVAWPTKSDRGRLVVSGETAPGARVKVEGRFVEVDDRGRYRTELHFADGVHQVRVSAEDVGGHVMKEQSPRIAIDTKTDFKVSRPIWK